MSFILDALRKSEIERQRQSGPNMAEFPIAREDRRLPIALIAIGALLALNAAVVVFFMLRDSRDTAVEATRAAAAAPSSATSPPAAAASSAQLPETQSALQAAASPQDEFAQSPVEMYGEQATLPPDAPDPTLVPDAPLSRPGVTYGQAPPDDAPAAVAATGLAELTIDLHIYTDDPAKRAVFINGRRYTQGAHIAEGPIVEEITNDGAVLSYRGRRFLLPRL